MAKSYTVEELRKLAEECPARASYGIATCRQFLAWLEQRDRAAELHPIAKIIGSECANADPGQTIAKSISDACKKHDLRLWPEVTDPIISDVDNRLRTHFKINCTITEVMKFLHWLRYTFSEGGE
jgi:hypothetical protein